MICGKTQNASLHRRMQCEARSCFAYEQLRECTTVHDRSSAVARHEIARNAPPPVFFLHHECGNQHNFAPLSAEETSAA